MPLLIPAAMGVGKAVGYGFAAYNAYQAVQKARRGDYKGAALDAALAVPSAGVAGRLGQALKWGQRGKKVAANTLRTAKAGAIVNSTMKEIEAENQAAAKASKPAKTEPVATQPVKTQPVVKTQPTVKPRVLSKLKGVQGTGVGKNFVARKWSSAESDRYKRVAAANQKTGV